MSPPQIPFPELVARLAEGHAAGLTVLTPNRRLAQAVESEVDAIHLASGEASWEAPDALPFSTFVERCHEEALHVDAGAALPLVLADAASRLVWEEVIRASPWGKELVSVPSTAKLASEAWELAHAWRIEGALRGEARSDDAEAFNGWADEYVRRTERGGFTDAARLPGVVAPVLHALALPRTLVLHAFDVVTPQQSDFLAACERAGVAIKGSDSFIAERPAVTRIEVESPREELEHAARWARARLEGWKGKRAPRIGIVVPDLAQRRREAARVFARTLEPAGTPPGVRRAPLFNLSLGEPLDAYPLVDAALALLELAEGPVAFDRASRLIRSPFIAHAEAEAADRARLDAALRRMAPASLSMNRLRQAISQAQRREHAPDCPRLLERLDAITLAARASGRATPHDWARRFTEILDAAGFPGERTLDSDEYQALEKWREALSEFAALGIVGGPWSAGEARSRLQRACSEALFQPKSGSAPVQVLGLLESAGLAFDHLWICGLTEDKWPISARPHPLIAPPLQRRAGIPQASPEASLAFDRTLTANWKRAAPEVIFSTGHAEGDRELLPSPLIAGIAATPVSKLKLPAFRQLRTALYNAGRSAITLRHDDNGPPLAGNVARGGSRILVDQAACPFRAFAHFRLEAHELERPEHGLGPLERGVLLHEMMGRIWETLKDQATLKATDDATLAKLTLEAATHAIRQVAADRPGRLDGRFAELEQKRLAEVAREWLQLELERAPFEVIAREEKMDLFAGDLRLSGRIDRMDRLESGGLAVIDYKSNRINLAKAWLADVPEDMQLPLYALSSPEGEVRAVAFARLKTGDRGFSGLASDAESALPGVPPFQKHKDAKKRADTWSALFDFWRAEVERLGVNFASGDARVDPVQLLRTCERCDLKALCRVHERLGALDEGEEFAEPGIEEDDE